MPDISQEELDRLKAAAASVTELTEKAKAAEDYKRDMLKHKDEAAARQAELDKIKSTQTEAEKKRLEEQGQYKVLADQEKEARLKAEKERDDSISTVDRFLKQTKVESAATAAGLLPTALGDIRSLSFDSLKVRKDASGVIQVEGVDELIASLKKDRPHYFGTGKPPTINAGGGGGSTSTGSMSTAELIALQKKDPAAYFAHLKEQLEAHQKKT